MQAQPRKKRVMHSATRSRSRKIFSGRKISLKPLRKVRKVPEKRLLSSLKQLKLKMKNQRRSPRLMRLPKMTILLKLRLSKKK